MCNPLGIKFEVTMGEISFPAVDPNGIVPATGSLYTTSTKLSGPYYANTNPTFHAAMLVRILALNVACGVASSNWFSFCDPLVHEGGTYTPWGSTSGGGLHNEAYVAATGRTFRQHTDGWQRPAWFSVGRAKRLFAGADSMTVLQNEGGLTMIRLALNPASGWAHAYLFWLDQYAPTAQATVEFVNVSKFQYYSLVPKILVGARPLDSNGYPRAVASLVWEWAGFHDAVLNEVSAGDRLTITLQAADPDVAEAPVCILTDGAYVQPAAWPGTAAAHPQNNASRPGGSRPHPRNAGPFAAQPTTGIDPADPPHPTWIEPDAGQDPWADPDEPQDAGGQG